MMLSRVVAKTDICGRIPELSEVAMVFRSFIQSLVFILFSIVFSVSCAEKSKLQSKVVEKEAKCQRIVSTAPSITETLFKFGLGDNVVGVTDDCSYPEKALKKEKIGRVLNINLEKLISLKPDTVMVINANPDLITKIKALGIKVVTFDHSTLNGFVDSLPVIAKECGKETDFSKAEKKYIDILNRKPEKTGLNVLVSIGRSYHSDSIKDVYVAGNDGFFSQIIKIAGLNNAYQGKLGYPKIQIEGIVSMNPDVIIDIVPSKEFSDKDIKKLKDDWIKLKDVKAVKNGRVFVINKSYWSIPGPRFIDIIKELSVMVKVDD